MSTIKSMLKINEGVGETLNSVPKGWIVRELFDEEKNRSVVFEFGIFINEDTFLGVPLHYSFKSKLIPIRMVTDDGFKYYYLNDDVEFGLSVFKNKKGKIFPILVEPSEKHPAMKMAAIAYQTTEPDKITHASLMREDNIIIRDYIDKDRNSIAVIIACNDAKVLNPEIKLNVKYGAIGTKVMNIKTFDVTMAPIINTETRTIDNELETLFIKFNRFIRKPRINKNNTSNK